MDEITKKTDEWINALKHATYSRESIVELDSLPGPNFAKVVDHQEFETLKHLLPEIKTHRAELISCLCKKFSELSSEDRHDVLDYIRTKLRKDDTSPAEKTLWSEVQDRITSPQRKAA